MSNSEDILKGSLEEDEVKEEEEVVDSTVKNENKEEDAATILRIKKRESPYIDDDDGNYMLKYPKMIHTPANEVVAFPVVVPTMEDVDRAIAEVPVGALPTALHILQNDVAALQNNVAALAGVPAALAAINEQLAALAGVPAALTALRDDIALANNRGCHGVSHPLSPRVVPDVVGPLPKNFPATLDDLLHMTGQQVNPFLNYWNVHGGHGGSVSARRKRLGAFLGIPRNML